MPQYFVRTSVDGPEKGPYSKDLIKESYEAGRLGEKTLVREDGKTETTPIAVFLAEAALKAPEANPQPKSSGTGPSPARLVVGLALVALGAWRGYLALDEYRFMSAAADLGLTGGGASPLGVLFWLIVIVVGIVVVKKSLGGRP